MTFGSGSTRRRSAELRTLKRAGNDVRLAVRELLAERWRWREIVIAREYVAAVERELVGRGGEVAPSSEAGRWITWARATLERMDPMRKWVEG